MMDIHQESGVDYFTQSDIANILSIFNGGLADQILAKNSNTDNDFKWVSNHEIVNDLNSSSESDALSAKQGKALGTYSFDETVIGYGPNGEKMYRKIITSTGISGNEVQVWHGITNLKQVFMKDASATYNGVTYFNNLTFKDIDDRFVKLYISNSNWIVYITLVYTKTVD